MPVSSAQLKREGPVPITPKPLRVGDTPLSHEGEMQQKSVPGSFISEPKKAGVVTDLACAYLAISTDAKHIQGRHQTSPPRTAAAHHLLPYTPQQSLRRPAAPSSNSYTLVNPHPKR